MKLFYNEISILKVIATLFITWFHFKWTVPSSLQFVFVGGAIGNALFFYTAGYLLSYKGEKFFGEWVINKLIRILPSIWVFLLTTYFLGNASSHEWTNYFYPTPFWFVNCILWFYIIAYLSFFFLNQDEGENKSKKRRIILILAIISSIANIAYYELYVSQTSIIIDEGGVKCWFFFFVFFLWGYWDKINNTKYNGTWKSFIGFLLGLLLFFAYKKIGCYSEILVRWQFLMIPLLLIPFVYYGRGIASWVMSWHMPQWFKNSIAVVSNLTLDIYIVQMFIINKMMPEIIFPINIVVTIGVIGVVAFVNYYLANRVANLIKSIV